MATAPGTGARLGIAVENPLRRWYGRSSFDTRNRASIGFNYQFPGVTHGNGFVKRVGSGWNLSSVIILQSGTPFTVSTSAPLSVYKDTSGTLQFNPGSGDFSADGDNYDFPNVTSYSINHGRRSYVNGLFPHCSGTNLDNCGPFTLPAIGQEGNEGINLFRNPGFSEVDATVKKITNITERLNLELRLDYVNLFNRVNLQGVDPNAADGTNFGRSTSTFNPRNAQLGAKLVF